MFDPSRIAKRIRSVIKKDSPAAFDYETNMLKPDSEERRIVTASIATDEGTFAFPWVGSAVDAFGLFLKSSVAKIGANIKFEERWTYRVFGHSVNNWIWDVVNDGHVLDNRKGISGLKFQAFVRLGQGEYDGHIQSKLKAASGNEKNKVHQIDKKELALYCGLDSLLTLLVSRLQAKEMGMEGAVG